MTRSEAIELAVRRHFKMVPEYYKCIKAGAEPWYSDYSAIRAHFRVICNTYGVIDDWPRCRIPKGVWDTMSAQTVHHLYPSDDAYDGHSLRT